MWRAGWPAAKRGMSMELMSAAAALLVGLALGVVIGRYSLRSAEGGADGIAGALPMLLDPGVLAHVLSRQVEEYKRYGSEFSLIYGEVGTEDPDLVRDVAERLRRAVRIVDEIGFAGRRVIIVLPHTSSEGARAAARRLAAVVEPTLKGAALQMTHSSHPENESEIVGLIDALRAQEARVF